MGLEAEGVTRRIIGCAMQVHRELGPGLLESVYEQCLAHELRSEGVSFERQVGLPIVYRGVPLEAGYRLDFVVEGLVVLELKSVAALEPIHEAQLLTYLRLSRLPVGLILNFNVPVLRDGILRRAMTRSVSPSAPSAPPR